MLLRLPLRPEADHQSPRSKPCRLWQYQRIRIDLFYCPFTDNPGGIIVFQVYFSMFMLNWLKSVSYETKSDPCKSLLQQTQSINGVDCGLLYCLLYCEIYSWIVNFDYPSQEEKPYACKGLFRTCPCVRIHCFVGSPGGFRLLPVSILYFLK